MAYQYIYTMKGLTRVHPPDKVVLRDIWLAFLPGAKIGVLGANGAGKSSLLRIMAGEDRDFTGEAFPAEGVSIGFLPQEPHLDPGKTVLGNIEEGVAETRALLEEYDRLSESLADDLSPEEMETALEQQGQLQDRIEAAGAWDLDSRIEVAMDALRVPPPDADVRTISGGERRRVALATLLTQDPDILLLDEPTNHLDLHHQVALLDLLAHQAREQHKTVIMVLHDLNLAARFADHCLLLYGDGNVCAGTCDDVLETTVLERLYNQPLRKISDRPPAWLPE